MNSKLTPHQQKVIAAMLAMEHEHGHRWWHRDTIGHVVGAGGYHYTIQNKTMFTLRASGLVLVEAETFPLEVRAWVRCSCSCHRWGLTVPGRQAAMALKMVWTDKALKAIGIGRCDAIDNLERGLEIVQAGGRRAMREREQDHDDEEGADWWKA